MSSKALFTRLKGLDGLRALSALLVLLFHAEMSFTPRAGFLGVDVFFVLSGFLITALLLSEFEHTHTIAFGAFYARRLRRLVPVMLLCVSVSVSVALYVAPDSLAELRRDVPAALTYTTNWWEIFNQRSYFETTGRPPLLIHLWSLAIEEQFYLLWPALLWLCLRVGNKGMLMGLALLLAITSTLVLIQLSSQHGYPLEHDPTRAYFGTDSHSMGLMLGACCAVGVTTEQQRRWRSGALHPLWDGVAVAALGSLLVLAFRLNEVSEWLYHGGFLSIAVLSGLVIWIVTHPASRLALVLEWPVLRWLGARSYGLYVWHWPVFACLRPTQDWVYGDTITFIARMALTLLLATLSYAWIEQPIRRLNASSPLVDARTTRRGHWLSAGLVVITLGALITLYVYPVPDTLSPPETTRSEITPIPANPTDEAASEVPSDSETLAIGDSVLLGAAPYLHKHFASLKIDAEVGRQAAQVIHLLEQLKAAAALPPRVILHLGTNGYVTDKQLTQILELLHGHQIILINAHAPRRWVADNNALMTQLRESHPEVTVLDWEGQAAEHTEYLVSDHIHLSSQGMHAFARLFAPFVPETASAEVASPPSQHKSPPVSASSGDTDHANLSLAPAHDDNAAHTPSTAPANGAPEPVLEPKEPDSPRSEGIDLHSAAETSASRATFNLGLG